MMRYKKITIDHTIYIKVLYDENISYLMVSTDDVLNTNNNDTAFTELRRVLKNTLRLKPKKYLSLTTWIFGSSRILLVSVLIRMIKSWN